MLHGGLPLRVVRDVLRGRMGVRDPDRANHVWWETDLESSEVEDASCLEAVEVPAIPEHYGEWKSTAIGGVSKTVRRVGILRANPKHAGPATVFSIRGPDALTVKEALEAQCPGDVQVVDVQEDAEYGHVTEVLIPDPVADAARVCAIISRAGGTPVFEDPAVDAERGLGVERLDRIEVHGTDTTAGLKRGCENWQFSFLPSEWSDVPITWEHLARNCRDAAVEHLPQPLRQHVAQLRLAEIDAEPLGGEDWCWSGPVAPATESELARSRQCDGKPPPLPMRWILEDEKNAIAEMSAATLKAHGWRMLRRDPETGMWMRLHRPEREKYERHIGVKRWVSAALSDAQSKQLVEAYYLTSVECSSTGSAASSTAPSCGLRAAGLVQFRYMVLRGYMGRWIGKYRQQALHIGNGNTFRTFRGSLTQYGVRSEVPAPVINRLVGVDGKYHPRGSKGSRSKHARNPIKRYVPRRVLRRRQEDERAMRLESAVRTWEEEEEWEEPVVATAS